jgi:hypothetical protein
MLAVCAKMIFLFDSSHPLKEDLLPIQGSVYEVKLGGNGSATYLMVKSKFGTHRYSSYYGKVWPGMELIRVNHRVDLLAEKDKLNKSELFTGNCFYIWELIHRDKRIIRYEDVRMMVQGKEASINKYINIWLVFSFVLLIVVYVWKIVQKLRQT